MTSYHEIEEGGNASTGKSIVDIIQEIKLKMPSSSKLKTQPCRLAAFLLSKIIAISVFADKGIGFDPQYKNKIFEVIQRLHSKEEYAGTGIGLALVKKIVENHHGIITANSELGKGITFDYLYSVFLDI